MRLPNTKSIERLDSTMEQMDEDSLRYQILQNAKDFKRSWISLGQALYGVWKDKIYKTWGYGKFEYYTSKEVGIKKQTALKLLRSYYFLEKEDPSYLKSEYSQAKDAKAIPTYDAINVLRLAKNKSILGRQDYESLKKSVFESGKDASELKKDLTQLIRQRQELEPDEVREKQRLSKIKRMISVLKSITSDVESSKMLPVTVLKQAQQLIQRLESEII